jgi:phosphomethylpyrimidine synthase
MCGPHFCSMELTQQLREYAESKGLTSEAAIEAGLEEKARDYRGTEAEGPFVHLGAAHPRA